VRGRWFAENAEVFPREPILTGVEEITGKP
jgi:hypothetical protein